MHSARAQAWIERCQEPGSIAVCRVVQMGTLRILTNPRAMGDEAIDAVGFWRAWDLTMSDQRFRLVEEPPTLEPVWRSLSLTIPMGKQVETDLYLAAFALAGGFPWRHLIKGSQDFPGFSLWIYRRGTSTPNSARPRHRVGRSARSSDFQVRV